MENKPDKNSNNNNYMRQLCAVYPICEDLTHKLSLTHFCDLVKIDDPLERSFYIKQTIIENWSTTGPQKG